MEDYLIVGEEGANIRFAYGGIILYAFFDRAHKGFGWENLKELDHVEERSLEGRITLKWIFKKWDGEHRLD